MLVAEVKKYSGVQAPFRHFITINLLATKYFGQ